MTRFKSENGKVVSSEDELLILVDSDDKDSGYLSKAACHDGDGVLHRAFSVFLFNEAGHLLLQQRSAGKRLWPMFWSNSCCSHPRKGESLTFATARRLRDELNISADLEYVYKFAYQASFGDSGSEHELCSVYLGRMNEAASPNQTEIAGLRFAAADALAIEFEESPNHFTPWFIQEWNQLNDEFADVLSRYTGPM